MEGRIFWIILGQEFENEMNANEMDNEMAEMDSMGNGESQNGGMKKSSMQKNIGRNSYPTAPVRDLIGVKFGIEKEDDRQLIQTRNKIQKGRMVS